MNVFFFFSNTYVPESQTIMYPYDRRSTLFKDKIPSRFNAKSKFSTVFWRSVSGRNYGMSRHSFFFFLVRFGATAERWNIKKKNQIRIENSRSSTIEGRETCASGLYTRVFFFFFHTRTFNDRIITFFVRSFCIIGNIVIPYKYIFFRLQPHDGVYLIQYTIAYKSPHYYYYCCIIDPRV